MKENKPANSSSQMSQSMDHQMNYRTMLIMTVFSFIIMYVLMYSMVNVLGNVYNNLNQAYMAALMAAPMVPTAILVMRNMYPDKRRNTLFVTVSIVVTLLMYFFIRQQTAIGDREFLRSMIPHHSSAILMCERAPITDPEIKDLCQEIIDSQQREIDQMKQIMERLK